MSQNQEESNNYVASFDPQDQMHQAVVSRLSCDSIQQVSNFAEQQVQDIQELLEWAFDDGKYL